MIKEYITDFKSVVFDILKTYDSKKANIFISGGSLLNILDNEDFQSLETYEWTIYFVDERVTEKEEDLNYIQANCFLKHIEGKMINLIDNNINKYNKVFDEKEADIALFGVGEDGHIESLFPNHDLMTNEYIIYVKDSPKPPPTRLTISLRAINEIKNIYFFIPPKNGQIKPITEPHKNITEKLKQDFIVYLAKQ